MTLEPIYAQQLGYPRVFWDIGIQLLVVPGGCSQKAGGSPPGSTPLMETGPACRCGWPAGSLKRPFLGVFLEEHLQEPGTMF